MIGETDLDTLLKTLEPTLHEDDYIFVSFPQGEYGNGAHLEPIGAFQEEEGFTLIVPAKVAKENNIPFESTFSCISLKVHSSLHAVGLTSAISSILSKHNISANIVAAYYHDHVFVPKEKAEESMMLLTELANS